MHIFKTLWSRALAEPWTDKCDWLKTGQLIIKCLVCFTTLALWSSTQPVHVAKVFTHPPSPRNSGKVMLLSGSICHESIQIYPKYWSSRGQKISRFCNVIYVCATTPMLHCTDGVHRVISSQWWVSTKVSSDQRASFLQACCVSGSKWDVECGMSSSLVVQLQLLFHNSISICSQRHSHSHLWPSR